MDEPSISIEPEIPYCKHCKLELETDLEKIKEAHWNCEMESLIYNSETQQTIDQERHLQEELDQTHREKDLFDLALVEKTPIYQLRRIIQQVIIMAKENTGLAYEGLYPATGIGVGSLRPIHVSNETNTGENYIKKTNWGCTIKKPNEWQIFIDKETRPDLYLIIAGFFNLSIFPSITEISIQANGIDLPIQNIEIMNVLPVPILWLKKPFIIAPNNPFRMEIKGRHTQYELFGLHGAIIGRRTELINRD